MTFLLKQIFQFFRLLNSDTGTYQIASGIGAGFILGMTPALSLQSLLVFCCILIFRIQAGAAFLTAFFFSFIAYLLDPLFHQTGSQILETASLQPLFVSLFNMPIVPFSRFNNSIVMGSGVISILLFPFIFIASVFLVSKYRKTVVDRFKETKFWKAVKATGLYKWYAKYDELYG